VQIRSSGIQIVPSALLMLTLHIQFTRYLVSQR